MKLFRNIVALEEHEEQVCFINMQFKSLWECPNQDEEVRAKHIVDTDHEPIPPLASERGELIELDDELMEDSIVANVSGVDANAQNVRKMPLQWEELTCQAKS